MITIERKGTTIQLNVKCSSNGYTYYMTYECGAGREDYAILLRDALAQSLFSAIKQTRSEAYEDGWKDAKKKTRKKDWFSGSL